MTGTDYLALPHPEESWIVEDLIPVGGSAVIFGDPKTGKSFAGLGIAMAVSNGLGEWLDYKVPTQGMVAFLEVDTPRSTWRRYLKKLIVAGYDPGNIWFADKDQAPRPFDILDPFHAAWLKDQMSQLQPALVVVDALREIHSTDENDSTFSKIVWSALVEATAPAALLVIHHAKKVGKFGSGGLMQAGRGSNYIMGKADFVGQLTATTFETQGRSENCGKMEIRREKSGLLVADGLASTKQKLIAEVYLELKDGPKHGLQVNIAREVNLRLAALSLDIPAERTMVGLVKAYMMKLSEES